MKKKLFLCLIAMISVCNSVKAEEKEPTSLELISTDYSDVYTIEVKDSNGNLLNISDSEIYDINFDNMIGYNGYFTFKTKGDVETKGSACIKKIVKCSDDYGVGSQCYEVTNICDTVNASSSFAGVTNTSYDYKSGYKYISPVERVNYDNLELSISDTGDISSFKDSLNYEFIKFFAISNMIFSGSKFTEDGVLYIPQDEIMDSYDKVYLYVKHGTFYNKNDMDNLENNYFWKDSPLIDTYIEGVYEDGYYKFKGVVIGQYYLVGMDKKGYTLKNNSFVFRSNTLLENNYKLNIKSIDVDKDKFVSVLGDDTLLNVYDISVMNQNQVVEMKNGEFIINIPVDDSISDYDSYSVVYINNDSIIEKLDAVLSSDKKYLTFKTTHLSQYGIVGNKDYALGDMNEDGSITLTDVIKLLKVYIGIIDENEKLIVLGDMNKDGSITLTDVIALLRLYLNM